jgi:NAD(P)H-flavin reductase
MTQDQDWDGETRIIDAQFFRDYLAEDLDKYTLLVAGPPGMVEGMQKALADAGANDKNVIAERYSGY